MDIFCLDERHGVAVLSGTAVVDIGIQRAVRIVFIITVFVVVSAAVVLNDLDAVDRRGILRRIVILDLLGSLVAVPQFGNIRIHIDPETAELADIIPDRLLIQQRCGVNLRVARREGVRHKA